MRIHNIGTVTGSGNDTISDYDYQRLKEYGVEEVWYWYWTEPYEGSGMLLATKAGKYYLHGMSHCSCNGPLDDLDISLKDAFSSIEEMRSKCSSGYMDNVEPLLLAAEVALLGH